MPHKQRPEGIFEFGTIMTKRKRGVPKDKCTLLSYNGKDQVLSSVQMQQELKKEPTNLIRVRSPFPSLDNLIGGFQSGELIVISGPTKMGKTLLAQTLTVNFNNQRRRVLWFSFEVPVRQFLSQFPSLPKIYLPGKLRYYDPDWLSDRVYECYLKHGTKIIIIDHLHYLAELQGMRNTNQEIGAITRQLKQLAVQGNFIVFLLANITKVRSDSDVGYKDIRDSSFIPQESDCVLMIRRTPNSGENAATLQVEFHRRTGVLRKSVYLVKFKGLLMEKSVLTSTKRGKG
jgi:replicative DNA helicase